MPGQRLDGLRACREAAGLSVQELAQHANVTDHTIETLECGGTCDPPIAERVWQAVGGGDTMTGSTSNGQPGARKGMSTDQKAMDPAMHADHTKTAGDMKQMQADHMAAMAKAHRGGKGGC